MTPCLFAAQGDDGIDARGAAGRNETGGQRNGQQKSSDAQEGEPVIRADSEQQAAHETRKCQAGDDADGHACQSGANPLTKNQLQNVKTLRSESDANADFASALQNQM